MFQKQTKPFSWTLLLILNEKKVRHCIRNSYIITDNKRIAPALRSNFDCGTSVIEVEYACYVVVVRLVSCVPKLPFQDKRIKLKNNGYRLPVLKQPF